MAKWVKAGCALHVCTDLWSDGAVAILALLVNTVYDGEMKEMLLGLVPASAHSHTALWIAQEVDQVLQQNGIPFNGGKVVTIHSDSQGNASYFPLGLLLFVCDVASVYNTPR